MLSDFFVCSLCLSFLKGGRTGGGRRRKEDEEKKDGICIEILQPQPEGWGIRQYSARQVSARAFLNLCDMFHEEGRGH